MILHTHGESMCTTFKEVQQKLWESEQTWSDLYQEKKLPKTPETAWSKDKHKGWERKKKKD